jgi:hypothetical protein
MSRSPLPVPLSTAPTPAPRPTRSGSAPCPVRRRLRGTLASTALLAFALAGCGGSGGGNGNGQTAPGIQVSATLSTVSANPTTAPADGTTACQIEVRLFDQNGLPLPGRNVELRVSSANLAAITAQTAAPTAPDGSTTAGVTSSAATTANVQVAVDPGANETLLSTTVALTFVGAAPQPIGVARFEDLDGDGTANAGDRVVVPFTADVTVSGANAADFTLPVLLDSLGTGAVVSQGPGSDEVTITLGTGAVLRARGRFAGTATNDPSGIDLAGTTAGITAGGTPAEPAGAPLDLVAGFGAPQQTFVGVTNAVASGKLNRDIAPDVVIGTPTSVEVFRGNGTASFTPAVTITTAAVRALALADLDGDGEDDLLVGEDGLVKHFENTSNNFNDTISFTATPATFAANQVRALVAGDLDCDGDLDVCAGTANGILVFENTGGTLQNPTMVNPLDEVRALALVDENGDGALDLVVGRSGSAAAMVLRGDGQRAFPTMRPLVSTGVEKIATGDLDGDAVADWAFVLTGGAVRVARSSDAFSEQSIATATNVSDVALTDLDGDGRDEVVTVGGVTRVYTQTSPGSFQTILTYDSGRDERSVHAADLDRDGDQDLLVGSTTDTAVRTGSASGVFGTVAFDTPQSIDSGTDGGDVALGDFNGDGILDAAVAYFDEGGTNDQNRIYLGDGDGTFTASGQTFGASDSRAVVAYDVDCDGDLDLVVANADRIDAGVPYVPQNNELWTNDGAGNFSLAASFDGGRSLGIAAGDLNRDGTVEIVVANGGGNQQTAPQQNRLFEVIVGTGGAITLNERSNAFGSASNPDNQRNTRGIALGDLDEDGDLDVVFANDGAFNQFWRGQDLTGVFFDFGGSGEPSRAVAVADFDRDGALDVVVGVFRSGTNRSRVYRGNFNNPSFFTQTDLPGQLTNQLPTDLVVADLDADGAMDIVLGNGNFAQSDFVYFGTGDSITFAQETPLTGNSSTAGIAVGDLDGDGDLEIVTAERNGIGVRSAQNR